ncbi:MAG TPA: hypothetical protein DCF63_05565, partial [Planctomycetaceae bacterium]|nr:hypothetical protein [Planctomycetaceae bacterium]
MLKPLSNLVHSPTAGCYPAVVGKRSTIIALWMVAWQFTLGSWATAQQQAVWEYAPYRVQIWYALEPNLNVTHQAGQRFLEDL